jgi:hypothetical protein
VVGAYLVTKDIQDAVQSRLHLGQTGKYCPTHTLHSIGDTISTNDSLHVASVAMLALGEVLLGGLALWRVSWRAEGIIAGVQ